MPKNSLRTLVTLGAAFFLLGAGLASAGQAAPPLSVYGNLPGLEMAALSPSGDRVALVGTVGGKRRLIVLGKDKAPLANADIGAEAKVRDLLWAGDELVLLETSATTQLSRIDFTADKAELFAMTVVPLTKGGKPWVVFDGDLMVRGGIQGFYGVNQRDGKWYGYFGGITLDQRPPAQRYLKSTKPVLYEVDLQTSKFTSAAPRPEGDHAFRDWLIDAAGKPSLTFDYDSRAGSWQISNRQHQKVAAGTNKLGGVRLIGFGSTQETFIYSEEDVATGEEHWYEAPIVGGEKKEILADVGIGGSFFDPDSRTFIGYRRQGDTPSYQFFDSYKAKVIAATQKAFPNLGVQLIDWNGKFDRLIVRTDGVGDAQNWWLVDIKTGSADQLGRSYLIASKDVGPMKMIRYKAGDGMDIPAVLTLPPGRQAQNLPVIVLPHGGPAARDYPVFNWWAQALATRGYAVLQPNFRGSTGYGADFERAGHGEWGRKMQSDISDGLAQLVKDGIADPKRACIVGASYGGYAALAGVTLQQGLYRCAVSVAGVSDLGKLVITSMSESHGDKTLMRGLNEQLGSGRDQNAVSPVKFAPRADAPILLIHGKDDTVVNFEQSSAMASALRSANKPVELVTLPNGDHWLSDSATRMAMLEATVAFVEKHNPPDLVPAAQ